MKYYLGVKLIQAEPHTKDGQEGYNVIYPDGYASWSPKEAFERAYLHIAIEHSITTLDVESMISIIRTRQIDPKTSLIRATLKLFGIIGN